MTMAPLVSGCGNQGTGVVCTSEHTTLEHCAVTGNYAQSGGGIRNTSSLTLGAGTIVGGDSPEDANEARGNGGGICNVGTVTMQNGSRVVGNIARVSLGGI